MTTAIYMWQPTYDIWNPSTSVKTRATFTIICDRTQGDVQSSFQYLSGDSSGRMILISETSYKCEIDIEHNQFNSTSISTFTGTSDVRDTLKTWGSAWFNLRWFIHEGDCRWGIGLFGSSICIYGT